MVDEVAENLGDENYLEPERAYSVSYTIEVTGGAGIDIAFKTVKAETILNGIGVKRIF